MLLLSKLTLFIIIFIFSFKNLFAADIPIIVIAPSKKAQSISTVGSSVTVYGQSDLENTNDYFLGDILSDGASSNFFQSGGKGTLSGIQIRGMPKHYSTVYIDGVKMSDASTPKNAYNFDDILSNQISRVEILKGNQSSVYGSGAMGGTINITTKRGQPGFQKNFFYNTGSHGTHNLSFSVGGADDKQDYYVGLERYHTDGISAMVHNDEDDAYTNHTLIANYGYKISDTIKLSTHYRFADARLYYDSVNANFRNDEDTSHEKESTTSLNFSYEPNVKFTNNLTFSNAYISRTGDDIQGSFTNIFRENNFWSYRNAVNYMGTYNFNLDNSVVFGIEKEWDEMDNEEFSGYTGPKAVDFKSGQEVVSQYIDFQSRLTNNLYATVGIRFDDPSQAGNEDSERVSLAYLLDDKKTKLKTSYGTGIKYPSLYEFWKNANTSRLIAEHGRSYDIGLERSFPELGLNFDITYFNHKYKDMIEGQKRTNWKLQNVSGTVRSQGIELASKFKPSNILNFNLNYTYNSTYDGADFDDPDMGPDSNGQFTNSQLARIPRHLINLSSKVFLAKNLDLTLQSKWSKNMRDYGNVNTGSDEDKRLSSFLVNDLFANYQIGDGYKAFFKIDNIFNKVYSTALQFNQMDRSFNFGIKRSY